MSALKNSEILFIYEVKLANPNGDPDDENRPRMDPKTRTNFVTDVRLKRFFRDYVISRFGENTIWVSKEKGENVDATMRLKTFDDDPESVKDKCIDVRLFGATIPKKGKEKNERGESISYTGPLQFSWGYSLHKVDMMDTRSITSMLSGREAGSGNIGKDYRVYYSLVAFYGAFSKLRAQKTQCTENDLKIFDNYIWEAVKTESITRSKIGHYPHLYIRVDWNDENYRGDLRRYLKVTPKAEAIRKLDDLEIDLNGLNEKLKGNRVYARCSDEMQNACRQLKDFPEFNQLPHQGIDLSG